jgi:lipopolysaccharide export LptBFGC system permease protein LptF
MTSPRTRPGDRLRKLAARVCSEDTLARLIDPAIADLQHEHADARRAQRVWKSRWLLIVGYVAVLKVLALHGRTRTDGRALARGIIVRAIVITLVVMVLFQLPPLLYTLNTLPQSHAARLVLAIYLAPQALSIAVPVGFALGILSGLGTDTLSRLAARAMLIVAVMLSMLSLVMVSWIIPAANYKFREAATGREVLKGVNELTLGEMHDRLERDRQQGLGGPYVRHLAITYHMRIAFSCATLVLALFVLAVRRQRRFVRVLLGLLLCTAYVGYYFALSDPIGPASFGTLSPIMFVWVPNLVIVALSIIWMMVSRQAQRDQPFSI